MLKLKKIETFYSLFRETVRDPRVKGNVLALTLGRSGRGSTIASALKQLNNMYKFKVSLKPRLVLNTYRGHENRAFFCKKTGKYGITRIYWKLYNKKLKSEISSAICLAGKYDFFVTARNENINLRPVGLEICETSSFFDPIYTIPNGWKYSLRECIKKFMNRQFKEGILDRIHHGSLCWQDVDWRIYESIRENLRKPLRHVGNEIGTFSSTIKKHLYDTVIPCCTTANFFFPHGYNYYNQIFIRFNSRCEKSIISALKCLPCTTYVFPLEHDITINIFHDNINDIFRLVKKLEEKDLTEDLLLSVPLISVF